MTQSTAHAPTRGASAGIRRTKRWVRMPGCVCAIMGDPGINFCDGYYSVMGFHATKRIRFSNEIKSTNKENSHLSVNLNLRLNNE